MHPRAIQQSLIQLPPARGYWVAFSGGLDSTCLLHALAAVRTHLSGPIRALHLNHGLQPQACDWVRHCQQLCACWEIPYHTEMLVGVRPQPGISLEALAREARLVAYKRTLQANEIMLTAHHQDDQVETLLLQLLRGGGLPGLAAMPKLSPLPPGWLARPLLDISRSQLRAYAQANNLTWIEDPSNATTAFDRNFLRHNIIPMIAQRWPAYGNTIARSAGHCATAQDLIATFITPMVSAARGDLPGTLSIKALLQLQPHICMAVLRSWLQEHGLRTPDHRRLQRIVQEVLHAAPDRSPLVDWPGFAVRRYLDNLFLTPTLPPPPALPVIWPDGDICPLPPPLGQLRRRPSVSMGLNPNIWQKGLVEIRFAVTGANCRPIGVSHRRSLKDIYRHHIIPNWLRSYVPLLYWNDILVAIAGVCVCESAMVINGGLKILWENNTLSNYWHGPHERF